MTEAQYLKIVRAFGLYHLLVALPLMIPIVSDQLLLLLGSMHNGLQLPGEWLETSRSQMLFVNLFASGAAIWALVRFRHPTVLLGRYEGWGMLLFSAVVIYHVTSGASVLWLVIPLVDLPGGVLHLYGARRLRG